jgi:hypothetical protein
MKNKSPRKYLVRVLYADWEVSNGLFKVKASDINDAFRAMFQWEAQRDAELKASKTTKPKPKKKKA